MTLCYARAIVRAQRAVAALCHTTSYRSCHNAAAGATTTVTAAPSGDDEFRPWGSNIVPLPSFDMHDLLYLEPDNNAELIRLREAGSLVLWFFGSLVDILSQLVTSRTSHRCADTRWRTALASSKFTTTACPRTWWTPCLATAMPSSTCPSRTRTSLACDTAAAIVATLALAKKRPLECWT